MSFRDVPKYLEDLRLRYKSATRKKERGKILDEVCQVTRHNRKYIIRILKDPRLLTAQKGKCGTPPLYKGNRAVERLLKDVWLAMDQPCAVRLKSGIPVWLPFFTADVEIKKLLLRMSTSSMDRILRPIRATVLRKNNSGTKRGLLLKHRVPIRDWNVDRPGYAQMDTVAHCGGSLLGDLIWSLCFSDIESQWTEARASWTKSATNILERIAEIERALPFALVAVQSDNGSEFMNHYVVGYFERHPRGEDLLRESHLLLSRSRSYQKNDNCFVEQKNHTHIRELFGYDRIDFRSLVTLMNDIYANEWSELQNFFQPRMKLKTKLKNSKGKWRKDYEFPKTAYQRLINSPHVSEEKKKELTQRFHSLNPLLLNKKLQEKLKNFYEQFSRLKSTRVPDDAMKVDHNLPLQAKPKVERKCSNG